MNTNEHMNYVDLSKNPERFTGYSGTSAARIWNAIYDENCFVPTTDSQADSLPTFVPPAEQCLEKRVFYRLISGLHSSISTHLCHDYSYDLASLVFETNVDRFYETVGKYPVRVHNLYLTYLMVLRAVSKALPAIQAQSPPSPQIQDLLVQLSQVSTTCPNTFDENAMFQSTDAPLLKSQFKNHFRNISVILDCVACERCKLWGKLQINGLGTALRILFDTKQQPDAEKLKLERTELVALIHTFRRLSESLKWSNEMFKEYRAKHVSKDVVKEKLNIEIGTGKMGADIKDAFFGGEKGADDVQITQDGTQEHPETYSNHDQSPQYDQNGNEQSGRAQQAQQAQQVQQDLPIYNSNAYIGEDYNETEELEYRRIEAERAAEQQLAAQHREQRNQVDEDNGGDDYNATEELEYMREQQAQAHQDVHSQHQGESQDSVAPSHQTQDQQVIQDSSQQAEQQTDQQASENVQVPPQQEEPSEAVEAVTPPQEQSANEVQAQSQQQDEPQSAQPQEQAQQAQQQAPPLPEVIDLLRNPPKTPVVTDVRDELQLSDPLPQADAQPSNDQAPSITTEQAPELPTVLDLLTNPPKTPFVPDVRDELLLSEQVEAQKQQDAQPQTQQVDAQQVDAQQVDAQPIQQNQQVDNLQNLQAQLEQLQQLQAQQQEPEPSSVQVPIPEQVPELPTVQEILQNPPKTPFVPDVKDEFQAEVPTQGEHQMPQENFAAIPEIPLPEHVEVPSQRGEISPHITDPEPPQRTSGQVELPLDTAPIQEEPLRSETMGAQPSDIIQHPIPIESDPQTHHQEQQSPPFVAETVVHDPSIPTHQEQHQDHHEAQVQNHHEADPHSHHGHDHHHGHSHHDHHHSDHGHSHGLAGMDMGMGSGMSMGMDGHGHHGHGHGHGQGSVRDLSSDSHHDDSWHNRQPEGFEAVMAHVMDAWVVTKVAVRNFYNRVILPAVRENSSMYSALAILSPIFIFFAFALRRKQEVSIPFADPIGIAASPSGKRTKGSSFAPAPSFTRPDAQVQAPQTPSKLSKEDGGARTRRAAAGPVPQMPQAPADPSLPFAPSSGIAPMPVVGAPGTAAPASSKRTAGRVPPSSAPPSSMPPAGGSHSPFVPAPASGGPPSQMAPSGRSPSTKTPSAAPQTAPAPSRATTAPTASPSTNNALAPNEPLINTTTPPPFNPSALPMPGLGRSSAPKAAAAAPRRRSIPVPDPIKK